MNYPYDLLGNIALVKFPDGAKANEKKKYAESLLRKNKSIKTVLEKTRKFSGRLRKQQTRWIAGEKTKEAIYRENDCVFRYNIDSTYFSPRLSNERKEIAAKVKKSDSVLVMFAGVAPFSIVIAKNSKASRVYSNEINREANKYAELNIGLNKLKGKVILLPGDIKKIVNKLSRPTHDLARVINYKNYSLPQSRSPTHKKTVKIKNSGFDDVPTKFDVIVMPRPQLKDSFLKEAFSLSKKGTRIFYYDFCKDDEIDSVVEKIKAEAKKAKKKVKILKVKKAGEIAPYRYRIRVDFVVN